VNAKTTRRDDHIPAGKITGGEAERRSKKTIIDVLERHIEGFPMIEQLPGKTTRPSENSSDPMPVLAIMPLYPPFNVRHGLFSVTFSREDLTILIVIL
jgi:hypothetical protein